LGNTLEALKSLQSPQNPLEHSFNQESGSYLMEDIVVEDLTVEDLDLENIVVGLTGSKFEQNKISVKELTSPTKHESRRKSPSFVEEKQKRPQRNGRNI
jgi:hypothetical protein